MRNYISESICIVHEFHSVQLQLRMIKQCAKEAGIQRLIRWIEEDNAYSNHYATGNKPFDCGVWCDWLNRLSELNSIKDKSIQNTA